VLNKQYRALALFSGGLDSLLSVKWMQKIGVEVIPIFFKTPFFTEERALHTATANGLKMEIVDISVEHLQMLQNPRYGFGKQFNPCIDCHGLMFKIAGTLMEKYAADFLISGEVLSQRPMSQRKDSMNAVAKLSGFKDLLVRPLSQQLLPDTKPIREGWIKKDDMLAFSGRSRKPQLALAKNFGIVDFPSPAGGCRLTDKNFTIRLRDLVMHNQLSFQDINLLKYGRHLRLDETTKLIIGRDEKDNDHILENAQGYVFLMNEEIPGPLGVLCTENISSNQLEFALSILAYYYTKATDYITLSYGLNFPLTEAIRVTKADSETVQKYMMKV
jgi:tRNA-specific 2-thiouridylase